MNGAMDHGERMFHSTPPAAPAAEGLTGQSRLACGRPVACGLADFARGVKSDKSVFRRDSCTKGERTCGMLPQGAPPRASKNVAHAPAQKSWPGARLSSIQHDCGKRPRAQHWTANGCTATACPLSEHPPPSPPQHLPVWVPIRGRAPGTLASTQPLGEQCGSRREKARPAPTRTHSRPCWHLETASPQPLRVPDRSKVLALPLR